MNEALSLRILLLLVVECRSRGSHPCDLLVLGSSHQSRLGVDTGKKETIYSGLIWTQGIHSVQDRVILTLLNARKGCLMHSSHLTRLSRRGRTRRFHLHLHVLLLELFLRLLSYLSLLCKLLVQLLYDVILIIVQ